MTRISCIIYRDCDKIIMEVKDNFNDNLIMRREAFTMANLAEAYEREKYEESDAVMALRTELEKGIESVKSGPLYTVEEAWKEIDAI